MRNTFKLCLVLVALMVSVPALAADVDGKWQERSTRQTVSSGELYLQGRRRDAHRVAGRPRWDRNRHQGRQD